MSILRVRHLHHGGHQIRGGLPIGARCCSASRGHLFQLGRHAEVGACASCVYDSEACSVRGVGAESRTPIAPKSSTRLETSSAAAVPPGTEASSRLDGPSSSMPAACPPSTAQQWRSCKFLQFWGTCCVVLDGRARTRCWKSSGEWRDGKSTRSGRGGFGSANAGLEANSDGLAPSGPTMRSPEAGARAAVGWAHLLHVGVPARLSPPHAGSVQGTLSTAIRRTRVPPC